jgi:hypothetical protein
MKRVCRSVRLGEKDTKRSKVETTTKASDEVRWTRLITHDIISSAGLLLWSLVFRLRRTNRDSTLLIAACKNVMSIFYREVNDAPLNILTGDRYGLMCHMYSLPVLTGDVDFTFCYGIDHPLFCLDEP